MPSKDIPYSIKLLLVLGALYINVAIFQDCPYETDYTPECWTKPQYFIYASLLLACDTGCEKVIPQFKRASEHIFYYLFLSPGHTVLGHNKCKGSPIAARPLFNLSLP